MDAAAPEAVVVGSGLAGLSCALELARHGRRVVVVTAGRAGLDGCSHRVHALAPWILLTAPRVRGDSPDAFLADLVARGEGLLREEVTAVFAASAHRAAEEIVELLGLEPLEHGPVRLPGDAHPRGLRCRPSGRGPLLAPLLAACRQAEVRFVERAVVVGLVVTRGGRVCGVVTHGQGECLREIGAEAVVLACGGTGAVFPVSTAPRFCRGSAVALSAVAGAMVHHPHLVQVLPLSATPRGFFPGSAALGAGEVTVGGEPLGWDGRDVDHLGRLVARAALAQQQAVLLVAEDARLPRPVQHAARARGDGAVPLVAAVHHGIGGVAIDAWGRTSLPGLYACGEAAGGVQGRHRTMGTGLIEARVFGVRAARAVHHDLQRWLDAAGPEQRCTCRAAARPAELDRRLDTIMGRVVAGEPVATPVAAELAAWPEEERPGRRSWLAGLRRTAALAMWEAQGGGAMGNSNATIGVGQAGGETWRSER